MRIHADPDPGQTLKSQKVEILHDRYCILKYAIGQKHTNEGTKALFKGRLQNPGLSVNFVLLPCTWIQDCQINADPCGSGSTTLVATIKQIK
jgi:hypothetical protein